MRLTGLGKFVILLLAIGFAIGGYRVWDRSQKAGGTNPISRTTGGNPTGANPGQPSTPISGAPTSNSGGDGGSTESVPNTVPQTSGEENPANASQVTLVTSSSQKGWLTAQVDRFNARGGALKVVPQFVETREAMHGILSGTIQPVLYCPSTTVWAQRLQSAWRQKNSTDILNPDDVASYRVFLKTPLVLVTTVEKARFLRPLLGRAGGWQKLRELGTGRVKPPWGKWKWAHADPLTANSGVMTMGALLADFADASGQSGDYATVASSAAFRQYVRDIERGLNFDLPAQSGSSALFRAFLADPNRYDAISSYESNALGAVAKNPNLAVIYPQPTVVSEYVATVLSAPWVSEQQKATAQEFVAFLGSPESIRAGVAEGLRPISSSSPELTSRLQGLSSQGFRTTFTATELPPYEALNTAAFNWTKDVRPRF